MEQGLLSAAIQGEAYNPEIMATVLRPMTRAEEVVDPKTGKGSGKFRAVVDLPDTDPSTGEKLVVTHTPASAVKRMKELPQIYGSLFKANVVSGLGSSSGTGLSNGKIDPRKLTQEQYLKIRPRILPCWACARRRAGSADPLCPVPLVGSIWPSAQPDLTHQLVDRRRR